VAECLQAFCHVGFLFSLAKFLQEEPMTYSVVGVRADGIRVSICDNVSREAAERTLSMIAEGPAWREFHILLNDNWPPKAAPRNGHPKVKFA
jgi:hypothetical protein